eukprot:TRINITY_DN10162_c0_g1_i1.p4 TRINITY_DN10162_c0_g1~~TRINITY_DN10162_c0_g1_i1.p4  ORF type:complete len:123 (-),score=0.42 TRINITY_DN10162_c0_g1_i1:30-398(-)
MVFRNVLQLQYTLNYCTQNQILIPSITTKQHKDQNRKFSQSGALQLPILLKLLKNTQFHKQLSYSVKLQRLKFIRNTTVFFHIKESPHPPEEPSGRLNQKFYPKQFIQTKELAEFQVFSLKL